MAGASDLTKFKLVMWKNWLLVCRNKKSTFWTIAVPVLLIGSLALFRAYTDQFTVPDLTYAPVGLDVRPHDYHVAEFAYTPKSFKAEMAKVDHTLGSSSIGFDTEQEVMDYIQASENITKLAGIIFTLDQRVNTLKVALRFYSETPWLVNQLWPSQRSGIRNVELPDGGMPPGYYPRGFVYVQHAIFGALNGIPTTRIQLQRMPVQGFKVDTFISIMSIMGAPLLILSFFTSFSTNVKSIVQEKEAALKEMMLIMGLPNYVAWLAWLAKCVLENLLVSVIGIVLLKVPFKNGVSCFPHTNALLLWLLMMLFIISLSSFSLLVSTFFRSSKRAILFLSLIFLVSMGPAWSSQDLRQLGALTKAFTLLFCPSAFGYAIKLIIMFEDMGFGLQWKDLFLAPEGSPYSIGGLMICMYFVSVLYILIALYMEQVFPGEFGTPRKWYFPIERLCYKRRDYIELEANTGSSADVLGHNSNRREEPRANLTPGISIHNLTKVFGKDFVAVNNLSMNMYENEITVLLGENGAGKSTTMSMLTGVLAPSSGSANIKGLDLLQDLKQIRNRIGLCPQKNVLFDQLTVEEHLLFFAQMKGLPAQEAAMDASSLMTRIGLQAHNKGHAAKLSGGTKRRLSLAIALCGNTDVIFLDEPTSGVDPHSRREIWNVLQEMKTDRTILLSTHFMDEADLLGDRVAILHNGNLKCVGSAVYLKTIFESSYKLTCALTDTGRVETVTEVIHKFVPDARMRDSFGREVAFDLGSQHAATFGPLFKTLEDLDSSQGVESFGIELPSLEDVFFKVQQEDERLPVDCCDTRLQVDPTAQRLLRGPGLYWNQFVAIVKKKFYFHLRNPFTFLMTLFFPTLLLGYVLYSQYLQLTEDVAVQLSPDTYGDDVVTLMTAQDGADAHFVERYEQSMNRTGRFVTVPNMKAHIFNMTPVEYSDFKFRSVVGAVFTKDTTLAVFSNEPYHSIPIALTAVYNAMIQGKNPGAPRLAFVNHPVPQRLSGAQEQIKEMVTYYILAMMMSFGFISTVSGLVQVYVQERVSGVKNMLFISGLSPDLYWLFSFAADLMLFSVSVCSVAVVLALDRATPQLWEFCQISVMFGCSGLAFGYLRSRRFVKSADLGSDMTRFGTFTALLYFTVYTILIATATIKQESVEMFLMLLPFFNLVDAVLKYSLGVAGIQSLDLLWKNKLMFGISGLVCMVLVILHDTQDMDWVYKWCRRRRRQSGVQGDILRPVDEDVKREVARVDAMTEEERKSQLVVASHLRKDFGNATAVKDATFVLDRGESLGLLGKNGAGKTSTFKMLTGEEDISAGDAWLKGISVRTNLLKTYTHFGYCPQFDAVLEELTGREWLEIVALVRGVPADEVRALSDALALELGFEKHMHKTASRMSGGNKRKLSTAVALIGEPLVIYMDEPTTGMDPSAKRRVWNVVTNRRHRGQSIVLTSHSMEECEALCTRVVILLEGGMEAVASIYRLKQKYSKTGHLVVQLRRGSRRSSLNGGGQDNQAELKQVLESKLMDMTLKEEFEGKLQYEFNAAEKLSKIFGLMESLKEEYFIECYAVSNQNSLVTIFLDHVTR